MKSYYDITDKSGFEFLRDYFSNLPKEKSLGTDKKGNYMVDFSWFFAKDLPRDIVQKAISKFIMQGDKNYESNCLYKGKNPESISQVLIHTYYSELSFIFVGADGYAKVRVVDKVPKDVDFTIPTIDLKQLENEIINTCFDQGNRQALSSGIMTNLNVACKNLVAYYDKLLELKKLHTTYACTLDRAKMSGSTTERTRAPYGSGEKEDSHTKKSSEIPFEERSSVLESLKPSSIVFVNEKAEDGTTKQNSYITYIYTDYLNAISSKKPSGYLFISEPYDSSTATRIYYVSQEDFNNVRKNDFGSKIESLTKSHLEMSQEEFINSGSIQLYHTTPEAYSEKMQFYVQGTEPENFRSLTNRFATRLKILYKDPSIELPYYKPKASTKDIAKIGLSSNTGKVDRTAQIMVTKQPSEIRNLS